MAFALCDIKPFGDFEQKSDMIHLAATLGINYRDKGKSRETNLWLLMKFK